MRTILFILIYTIFLLSAACTQSEDNSKTESVGLVEFYFQQGRYFDVLSESNRLAKEGIQDTEVDFILAKTYLIIGQPERAYELFQKVGNDVAKQDIDLWKAEALFKQGRIADAKDLVHNRNKDMFENESRYFLLLGQLDLSDKNLKSAVINFSKIPEQAMEYPEAQLWLIQIDLSNNKKHEALAELSKLLDNHQELSLGWLLKGNLDFNDQNYYEAENSYMQVLRLDKSRMLTQQVLNVAQRIVQAKVAQGDAVTAENFYQSFLDSYPETPIYHYELAKLAFAKKDLDKSLEHLGKIQELMPNNINIAILQLKILLKQNKSHEAKTLLDVALSSSESNVQLMYLHAITAIEVRGNEKAIAVLEKYLSDQNINENYIIPMLAYFYDQSENINKSEELINDLDLSDAEYTQVLSGIGSVFIDIGKNAEAENFIRSHIRLNPNITSLKMLLLNTLEKQDKKEELAIEIENWVKDEPTSNQAKLVQIKYALDNKNIDKVYVQLSKLNVDKLDNSEVNTLVGLLSNIAIYSDDKNKRKRLIDLIKPLEKKLNDNLQLKVILANLYITDEKYKEAIPMYEKSLEHVSNAPGLMNNLAWSYFKVKDKRALEYAEAAYNIAPENAAIADTYGWILLNQGETEKGFQLIEKALQLQPENIDIQKHYETAKEKFALIAN